MNLVSTRKPVVRTQAKLQPTAVGRWVPGRGSFDTIQIRDFWEITGKDGDSLVILGGGAWFRVGTEFLRALEAVAGMGLDAAIDFAGVPEEVLIGILSIAEGWELVARPGESLRNHRDP